MAPSPTLSPSHYVLSLQFLSPQKSHNLTTFNATATLSYATSSYFDALRNSHASSFNLQEQKSQTLVLNSASNCCIQSVTVSQNGKKIPCRIKEKMDSAGNGGSLTGSDSGKKRKASPADQRKDKKKLKKLAKNMNMKKSEIIRVTEKDVFIHIPELDVYAPRLIVEIRYSAEVQHKAVQGIFMSGPNNEVVTTLFEPRFARTVFPCTDDMQHRAKFELSVTVPYSSAVKRKVLSNWPIKSIRDRSSSHGTKTYEFQCTDVELPTYLMAFTIGDYITLGDNVHCTTHEKKYFPVQFHALSTSANKLDADFFMTPLLFAMQRLETLFGMDIDLPKLDLVIVPTMALGGMEHHGSIFLAEAAAIISSGKAYDSQRDELVELIIHEVAHYFVGNITGLPFWVKEGLAQYYELNLADEFLSRRSLHPKLKLRSGGDSHHMSKGAGKDAVSEAGFLFTNVTYDNSLQLILSMEQTLGRDDFRSRIAKLIRDNVGCYVTESQFVQFMAAE